MSPIVILLLGMAVVLGAILVLRLNAFLALIGAALLVSLLAPGDATVDTAALPRVRGVRDVAFVRGRDVLELTK